MDLEEDVAKSGDRNHRQHRRRDLGNLTEEEAARLGVNEAVVHASGAMERAASIRLLLPDAASKKRGKPHTRAVARCSP
eukprot:12917858-Prorocentrum_lima.AAC.1